MKSAIKLSLAANPWYWPRQVYMQFYEEVADLPVDIVYLGETVCSRRHELRASDWLALARSLAARGKEVVLSSLALLESESDLKALARLIAESEFQIEANDMSAVHLLSKRGLPFVAGASLNIYNAHTLALLAELGARRWVLPPETGHALLRATPRPACVETEILAHGRLPLAWSARCFTARRFNLQKDSCAFKCMDFPEGMMLQTREAENFLVINGIQTLSAKVESLLAQAHDLENLHALGVNVLRIVPQAQGIAAVVAAFRAALEGKAESVALAPDSDYCNGFWFNRPGNEWNAEGKTPL